MDGFIYFQNNIKKGLIYIAFWRKIKGRRFKTIAPYDKEMMQGKKNNLPPKAPEPYVLDETFTGLFKPFKKRRKIVPPPKDDGTIPNLPELPKSEIWHEGWDLVKKEG